LAAGESFTTGAAGRGAGFGASGSITGIDEFSEAGAVFAVTVLFIGGVE
jgi:hypothetical protein